VESTSQLLGLMSVTSHDETSKSWQHAKNGMTMEFFLLCGIENWYVDDVIWEESLVLNEKSFQPNNTKTKRNKQINY
jgi:hypothetical protein